MGSWEEAIGSSENGTNNRNSIPLLSPGAWRKMEKALKGCCHVIDEYVRELQRQEKEQRQKNKDCH